MEHTKFCDIRTCNKVCGVDPTFTPDREKVKAYAEDYLTPANVGARKGIFVPRELVNKLSKLVALYDVEGLTIGAYVTNILVNHLVDNRDAINELSSEGRKDREPMSRESYEARFIVQCPERSGDFSIVTSGKEEPDE